MTFAESDLSQLKEFIEEAVENGLDGFGSIVAKGFEGNDRQFQRVFKRLDQNDAAHRRFDARLDVIEHDITDLREMRNEILEIRALLEEVVTRKEFEKLEKRLNRVEQQLGLVK